MVEENRKKIDVYSVKIDVYKDTDYTYYKFSTYIDGQQYGITYPVSKYIDNEKYAFDFMVNKFKEIIKATINLN